MRFLMADKNSVKAVEMTAKLYFENFIQNDDKMI